MFNNVTKTFKKTSIVYNIHSAVHFPLYATIPPCLCRACNHIVHYTFMFPEHSRACTCVYMCDQQRNVWPSRLVGTHRTYVAYAYIVYTRRHGRTHVCIHMLGVPVRIGPQQVVHNIMLVCLLVCVCLCNIMRSNGKISRAMVAGTAGCVQQQQQQ